VDYVGIDEFSSAAQPQLVVAPRNSLLINAPLAPKRSRMRRFYLLARGGVERAEEVTMRALFAFVALIAVAASSGCYTEYAVRPAACNAVWVPPHRGYWGRWHPGHWRCV